MLYKIRATGHDSLIVWWLCADKEHWLFSGDHRAGAWDRKVAMDLAAHKRKALPSYQVEIVAYERYPQ